MDPVNLSITCIPHSAAPSITCLSPDHMALYLNHMVPSLNHVIFLSGCPWITHDSLWITQLSLDYITLFGLHNSLWITHNSLWITRLSLDYIILSLDETTLPLVLSLNHMIFCASLIVHITILRLKTFSHAVPG